MQICRRCLYTSNHPLNLVFDQDGICSGCRVHEEKDKLPWDQRSEKLRVILNEYKNQSGKNYDCIVPVSGAADSYFVVDTIKNVYGMNPLLVTYNKQYNTAVGIRNLANLRLKFDCDILTMTVNPEIIKKITKGTLRRFGSIYWHCIAGQTVYPVQVAVQFKIPLIVWGAHQGVDQVGMFSHLDEVEMTRKYRKEHDLMGYEPQDLVDDFDEITEADVKPFAYPDSVDLERVGVRGIYLNNFIRWDSKAQHELMIEKYDYETAKQNRTFDSYNNVDCWNYSDIHDYIKQVKHGYGKVVDHVSREIRLGRMSRIEGIQLIKYYSFREPKYLSLFLEWLGVTHNSFYYILNQHRNKLYWKRNDNWDWEYIFNYEIADEKPKLLQEESKLSPSAHGNYILTKEGLSSDATNKYILIGRGVL